MRPPSILAVLLSGLLLSPAAASAQQTTESLGTYTTTTEGGTYTTTTQGETAPQGEAGAGDEGAVAPENASGTAPAAAQEAGTAPERLAFTGAEPVLLIAFGMLLAGGAVVLLRRDRRRGSDAR